VTPALKRQNSTSDKHAQYIISRRLICFPEPLDVFANPVVLFVAQLRIIIPIEPGGDASHLCRQIDEINWTGILDIEKSSLPFPA
jgi:hypothetical protein